jgi:AcrR family transcriptional regulator
METGRAPQQQRGRERRRALLEGASRVFDRVGFAQASLSDIARESHATMGSLYFYFPSKEQLALAIITEQNARTFSSLEQAGRGHDTVQTLLHGSKAIADQLLTDAVVRAGIRLSMEQGTLSAPTNGFYADWIGGITDLVELAAGRGILRRDFEAAQLSRMIVATFTGTHVVSNVLTGRADVYAALHVMWGVVLRGLVEADRVDPYLEESAELFASEPPERS